MEENKKIITGMSTVLTDGTLSNEIPFGVISENVELENKETLADVFVKPETSGEDIFLGNFYIDSMETSAAYIKSLGQSFIPEGEETNVFPCWVTFNTDGALGIPKYFFQNNKIKAVIENNTIKKEYILNFSQGENGILTAGNGSLLPEEISPNFEETEDEYGFFFSFTDASNIFEKDNVEALAGLAMAISNSEITYPATLSFYYIMDETNADMHIDEKYLEFINRNTQIQEGVFSKLDFSFTEEDFTTEETMQANGLNLGDFTYRGCSLVEDLRINDTVYVTKNTPCKTFSTVVGPIQDDGTSYMLPMHMHYFGNLSLLTPMLTLLFQMVVPDTSVPDLPNTGENFLLWGGNLLITQGGMLLTSLDFIPTSVSFSISVGVEEDISTTNFTLANNVKTQLNNLLDGTANGSVYQVAIDNQWPNSATGGNSVAFGSWSRAKGGCSFSHGFNVEASGSYSTAEGERTVASGSYGSHAEGLGTTASGDSAHAEGAYTTASGDNSHAEGQGGIASERYAHAEGLETKASGEASHAEGWYTTASNRADHAEGFETTASGYSSHAEGYATLASGMYSHAQGESTIASGQSSYAGGVSTQASGLGSHAEGQETKALGQFSNSKGVKTTALGYAAHAEGKSKKAKIDFSFGTNLVNTNEMFIVEAQGVEAVPNSTYSGVTLKALAGTFEKRYITYALCPLHYKGYFKNSSLKAYVGAPSVSGNHQVKVDELLYMGEGDYFYISESDSYSQSNIPEITAWNTQCSAMSYLEWPNGTVLVLRIALDVAETLQSDISIDFPSLYVGISSYNQDNLLRNSKDIRWFSDTYGQEGAEPGNGYTIKDFYDVTSTEMTGAISPYSHAEGMWTSTYGEGSHAEGVWTVAGDEGAHAEGYSTETGSLMSEGAHAEGYNTFAGLRGAHAEGYNTFSQGIGSHAEGSSSKAIGEGVHAEGNSTFASATGAHAEGEGDYISLDVEAVSDINSIIITELDWSYYSSEIQPGLYGVFYDDIMPKEILDIIPSERKITFTTELTESQKTNDRFFVYIGPAALKRGSHAEGAGTIAASDYQHVQGIFNEIDKENKYAHIIGNGEEGARSNAHTVDWDGNAYYAGKVTVGTDPVDAMDVVTKQYLENNSSAGGFYIKGKIMPNDELASNPSVINDASSDTTILNKALATPGAMVFNIDNDGYYTLRFTFNDEGGL